MTAVVGLAPLSPSERRTATQGFLAAGRRGVKALAQAVLPSSVMVWRGPQARLGTPASERRLALTFDDGPTDLTSGYLSVLEAARARATFFVVGELCEQRPELVSAIASGGHELSGHGYTHRRFPTLSTAELRDELVRTAALLPKTRRGRPLVRPPYGAVSVASLTTCARAGFTTAMWSHDSGDWRTKRPGDVVDALEDPGARVPDAVVLLHEGYPWTMDALPKILRRLKDAGHELVTMGELLDA